MTLGANPNEWDHLPQCIRDAALRQTNYRVKEVEERQREDEKAEAGKKRGEANTFRAAVSHLYCDETNRGGLLITAAASKK